MRYLGLIWLKDDVITFGSNNVNRVIEFYREHWETNSRLGFIYDWGSVRRQLRQDWYYVAHSGSDLSAMMIDMNKLHTEKMKSVIDYIPIVFKEEIRIKQRTNQINKIL